MSKYPPAERRAAPVHADDGRATRRSRRTWCAGSWDATRGRSTRCSRRCRTVIHVSDRGGGAARRVRALRARRIEAAAHRRRVRARPPERADVRGRRAPLPRVAARRAHGLARRRCATRSSAARSTALHAQPRARLDARGAGARGRPVALGAGRALHASSSDSRRCSTWRTGGCSSPRTTC